MAITWSSDYLYVLAMLRTTPLVVTVGISLTIPVAVLGDFILNVPVHAQVMVGATLVLIGFATVGTDKSNTEDAAGERPIEVESS
jgi:solute carrier family 35 protein F5